jgi:hypothetical protein
MIYMVRKSPLALRLQMSEGEKKKKKKNYETREGILKE